MAYRMATDRDRDAVEALWSYSFEPKGDPFFTYYFTHCYRPEDTLLAVQEEAHVVVNPTTGVLESVIEEAVMANLHLRPYTLMVGAEKPRPIQTSYIVGVSTAPHFRNRKVGRDMLREALTLVAKRGEPISILMPSRAGFYQPHGWELYCHQWERVMPLRDAKALGAYNLSMQLVDSADMWPLLATVYETFTASLHGYAVRGEAQWRTLIGSWLAEGVYIAVACQDGQPVGYMVYRLGAPEIFVPEFIYTNRQGQKALLGYLAQHQSQAETVRWNEWLGDTSYRFFPDGKRQNQTLPFMMARITDPLVAFEGIPVTGEGSLVLHMQDPLVSAWTGVYRLTATQGVLHCERLPQEVETENHIDVGALSLLYLQVCDVETLAFEGRLVASSEVMQLLGQWFPVAAKPAFINEWY